MDLSWMSRLCNPRDPAPVAHRPVTFELDGAPWAVATEGHVLVAIREDTPSGFPPAPAEQRDVLARLLTVPRPGTTTDLAALRAWAEPPQWPGQDPCRKCAGAGTVRCERCGGSGSMECICPSCDDQHEADCGKCRNGQATCPTCDGTGRHGETLPVRPGRIGPALINRELLARALAELPGDTATLAAPGPRDPVYMDGPAWRIVVSPMSDRWITAAPEWPLAP